MGRAQIARSAWIFGPAARDKSEVLRSVKEFSVGEVRYLDNRARALV